MCHLPGSGVEGITPCVAGLPGGGFVPCRPLHIVCVEQYGWSVRISQNPPVHRQRERDPHHEGVRTRGKVLALLRQ